ncbi:hypothetical protein C1752_08850 [Acaryochloris thomasi RCC1774]|uniref:HNH nuclease domain-containing protein n=1 Tax=Acaryochloris thomasi RCC1774 TaxID=1764569 RepID=A0A2W1JA20_9CYAN|nr:hypothetical protein C1752_08850 [Acaryochloris thomasi RCC1774]
MPTTRSGGKRARSTGGHDLRNSGGTSTNYNETPAGMKSRPQWNEDVKTQVYADAHAGGGQYRCAETDGLYPKNEMSIDHIVPWKQYCYENSDVNDRASVTAAYNNISNLRLVSRSANSSMGDGGNHLNNL